MKPQRDPKNESRTETYRLIDNSISVCRQNARV
jgi:hypothetical protein